MVATAAFAVALWLHARAVRQELGPVPIGIKLVILLDFRVVDDATGEPIPGALVDLPFLHPAWRSRPDLAGLDLRTATHAAGTLPPPFLTDEGGRSTVAVPAGLEKPLVYRANGILPVAGDPEVVFHPVAGVRVRAAGYSVWANYLEDIREDDGRRLANDAHLPIVARLKRASRPPTTSRK